VEDVIKRRFNSESQEYEFFTSWKDTKKKTWEPKSSFIDEDGAVTDILLNFEERHPAKKIPSQTSNNC
jgi:hypothetical protein